LNGSYYSTQYSPDDPSPENQNFIVSSFTTSAKNVSVGDATVWIGWDPTAKNIRAWLFDSTGGFGQGFLFHLSQFAQAHDLVADVGCLCHKPKVTKSRVVKNNPGQLCHTLFWGCFWLRFFASCVVVEQRGRERLFGLSFFQIHTAMFSLVGFSRPGTSFR